MRKKSKMNPPVKHEMVPLAEAGSIDYTRLNLPTMVDIRASVVNLEGIPDEAAMVLSLVAFGFSYSRVAAILGCAKTTVVGYCERYDPQGLCRLSNEDRRVLTTQMLGSTAIAALMEITQEKLAGSEAKDLAAIASRCATTAAKLSLVAGTGREDRATKIGAMMDALDVAETAE